MKLFKIVGQYRDAVLFARCFDLFFGEKSNKHHFNIAKYYLSNRKVLNVVKDRQIGLTTLNVAYAWWLAQRFPNKKIMIISPNAKMSKHAKEILKNLCLSTQFGNGSKIVFTHESRDPGRGESLDLAIIDEAAYFKDLGMVWQTLQPALNAKEGQAIFCSSTEGASASSLKHFNLLMRRFGWINAKRKEGEKNESFDFLSDMNPFLNEEVSELDIVKDVVVERCKV